MRKTFVCLMILSILIFSGCDNVIIRPLRKGPVKIVEHKQDPTIVPLTTIDINETKNINIAHERGNGNGPVGSLIVQRGGNPDAENRSKRIPIVLQITADYPKGPIVPKYVLLDGEKVSDNSLMSPGSYSLRIYKPGYKTLNEDGLSIPKKVREFRIIREIISKPRIVRFDIRDYKTGRKISPDQVIINKAKVKNGDLVKPGKKTLSIKKKGYLPITRDSFTLSVGEDEYILKRKMSKVAVPTVLKWRTETSFPPGEEVVVETVRLDGKEIDEGVKVPAGKHTIEFIDPRFEPGKKSFSVPRGVPSYTVEDVLIPLPREVVLTVKYDVEPTSQLGETRAVLVGKSKTKILVKPGIKVRPAMYELQIDKQAYFPFRKRQPIYPGTSVKEITAKMESKPVVVQAQIQFDIKPPSSLDPYLVTFIGRETQVRTKVSKGGSIKPGKYFYIVEKPGYKMAGGQKPISIEASEDSFLIRERMIAEERQIAFDIRQGQVIIRPYEVIINGKKLGINDRFKPGRKYSMIAKFRKFRTVTQNIQIIPGPGPQVVSVKLIPK